MKSTVSPVNLPPVTGALPPWAKVLLYLAETVAFNQVWKAFDYGITMLSTGTGDATDTGDEWRRFVIHASNRVSVDSADAQVFSFDFVNITNGVIDNSWTDADHSNIATQLEAFVNVLVPLTANIISFDRIDAYARAFNPYTVKKPFADSGPPVWSRALTGYFGAASPLPPQNCTTITEETPARRHWGRTYTPTLGAVALDPNARLTVAAQDAILNDIHTRYESLANAEYYPVVPTTWSGKTKTEPGSPTRTLQLVTGVRIDDVTDVHRSRRYRHANRITSMPTPGQAEQQPAAEEGDEELAA